MSKEQSFKRLREMLAEIYTNANDINIVARDAGINVERINLDENPNIVWQAVLDEAHHADKIVELLDIAREGYRNLGELCDTYLSFVHPEANLQRGTPDDDVPVAINVDQATTPLGETAIQLRKPDCPYPGMASFGPNDHAAFYGRSREVDELVNRLRLHPFMAVIGPSGSGKSSLVAAGLIPALHNTTLPELAGTWTVRAMRPGAEPLNALKTSLAGLVDLHTDSAPTRNAGISDAGIQHLLLFVDQFEETFARAAQQEGSQVAAFLTQLQALIESRTALVVLTVRADFYADLMTCSLWPQIRDHREEVLPLDAAGLREAIVQPALHVGVEVDGALAEALVRDAANEPGALPFVQETLVLLWEKMTARTLSLAEYAALSKEQGDRNGLYVAMTQRADVAMTQLSDENRMIARRILLRLIQFGEGRSDTRRQQRTEELRSTAEDDHQFERILDHLTSNRLITMSGQIDAQEERTVDIAHEALLSGWPQLRTWIDERRAAERTRRRLEDKAAEWVRLGRTHQQKEGKIARWIRFWRTPAGLLDAVALKEATDWLESDEAIELGHSIDLPALVEDSKNAITRNQRIWASVAVTIVLLAIGFFWTQSQSQHEIQRQSQINRVQALQAQSLLQREVNAECSLTLALSAYDVASIIPDYASYQTQNSVRDALQATHVERVLLGHEASIQAVAWSNDGRYIASGDVDGRVNIWSAETGEQLHRFDVNSTTRSLNWHPDSQQLAIGSGDDVSIWSLDEQYVIQRFDGHTGSVRSVQWSPDGTRLASTGDDEAALIWDVAGGGASVVLEGHSKQIWDIAWHPDGTQIASLGWLNTIRIWDTETGEQQTLLRPQQPTGTALVWSSDGRWLLAGYGSGVIERWDNSSGEFKLVEPIEAHTGAVRAVALYPDDNTLASVGEDNIIHLWDLATGEQRMTLTGHTDNVWDVAWGANGERLVTSSQDGSVRVWRVGDKQNIQRIETENLLLDAVWSPDGERLAWSEISFPNTISLRIMNMKSNQTTLINTAHWGTVTRIAWSPNGQQIVTASADESVHIYDVDSGELVSEFTGHTAEVLDVVWHPEDGQLASASFDGTVRLWDIETGESSVYRADNTLNGLTWSPDGKMIAAASTSGAAWLWDIASDEQRLVNQYSGAAASVAWDDSSRLLAVGLTDGSVSVWDVVADKEVMRVDGHNGGVWDVDWHGDLLASAGGGDGLVQLWDVATQENIATLTGHTGIVRAVDWHPDGDRVVSVGGTDGLVLIHQTNFEEAILPLARAQQVNGSTEAGRTACLAIVGE
ncbi:MAG: effector-associated domain EAD1-containing protein [Chloroflexota bacterium]